MEWFNEERLRIIYNTEGHDGTKLPDWLVERIIIRSKLLSLNEHFKMEWENLSNLHATIHKELNVNVTDAFKKKCKDFYERWHISFPNGTHNINTLCSRYVFESYHNTRFGRLTIDIDLTGPKDKISKEIDSLLTYWKKEYEAAMSIHNNHLQQSEIDDISSQKRVPGNVKKDIQEYGKALGVYVERKEGKSWRKIKECFNLNNIDTARRYNEKAQKLIKEGLPGLPPFPQK